MCWFAQRCYVADISPQAALILLKNDFASIPVAIEMGRLVFDNLKKVTLYLMPVSNSLRLYLGGLRRVSGGKLRRVYGCLFECLTRHANAHDYVSAGLLLYHE